MTAPPDPFASVVTARDVYDAVRETQSDVRASLARLRAVEDRQSDHERRLRALEMWRYALPVSALASIAAAVAAIMTALGA